MTDWTGVQGQYPTNPEFTDAPPALYSTLPYSYSIYRQDDYTNLGYPYIVFFPLIEKITPPQPVKQHEPITVYDHRTEKIGLQSNGLAILSPSSVSIHEVINGEWTLTLTHPCDADGKWKYIREHNIIKCMGQYYTVKRLEWDFQTSKSGEITATCEHIFYQLCDMWCYAWNWGFDTGSVQNTSWPYCIAAINHIMGSAVTDDSQGQFRYDFEWDSNWIWDHNWICVIDGTGCTPVELLLGTNGIIGSMGGELYRNNFYFSIEQRMEGALDDAFDIRIGLNLRGIKRTVDVSDIATLFRLYEGHGSGFVAISYNGETSFPLFQFPHNITRSDAYSFPDDVFNAALKNGESLIEPLGQICSARWRKYALPTICYEVDIKDVRQNPDYEEIKYYRYKVGDEGRIWDERLGESGGYVTLRITETETDGITGEVTRVVFGSKSSFTKGAAYPNNTQIEPNESFGIAYLRDNSGAMIIDKNNKLLGRRYTL